MNQVFNQSKNKRIIVISFLSLSPISNTSTNVFELFASFKAANALNHWNLSLIQAVQNCVLVGHIDPHVIMLGGSQNYLEIIKLAWMKQILKSPLGFTIQYLGELCNFLVSKTPQCSTVELEEAICKCVCELVNTGLPSNLKYIIRYVTKFLPATGDNSACVSENFLSTEMIKSIIDSLQQKGLIYNTGHGYNVMTADKLRVAKWLGDLPDTRLSFSGSDSDENNKRASTITNSNTQPAAALHAGLQKPTNRYLINRDNSENTDDCLSCYDLRGNKYYSSPTADQKAAITNNNDISHCSQINERYRTNCLDNDITKRDSKVLVSTDASLNKPRMLCSNVSKKDMSKRQSCVKYESNFISRIICGMKKLRIHWPAKNGVVRSTNIGVPEIYNKNYYNNYIEDTNVINSRLSQSMYTFNQITAQNNNNNNAHHHGTTNNIILEDHLDLDTNNEYLDHCRSPTDLRVSETFMPYGATKSISPVGCYGLNYASNDIERSFMLIDEQRCCSELMLTGRSSMLTPNLYPIVPSHHPSHLQHMLVDNNETNKPIIDRKDDLSCSTINDPAAIITSRYFSPFTCDSGFNSVHGGLQMPENDTSQSKTSSPPDMTVSAKKTLSLQYSQYGGPCAWQINSLNDSLYQTRNNYQSPVLAPVIESTRYMK